VIRHDLEKVADYAVCRYFEKSARWHRGLIAIITIRILHPDQVLDRAADPAGKIESWDGPVLRSALLVFDGQPTGLDGGSGAAHHSTQFIRQFMQIS